MSKINVNIGGENVVIDTSRPKVAAALADLVKACAERQFPIGLLLTRADNDEFEIDYLLSRIKQFDGGYRAYLVNTETGRARNSRKVVMVQEPDGGGDGHGYVTDLPAEHDRFLDDENPGEFIEV